ncbi:TVG1000457 [Thermoplasma volcanium GSS1]|uniref:TVG1000457 protein n=1 Tax=Thermoplasma volcanium (strain ATCC 51530 / DSM 4299 / JCM 9571 / NBRC 15438 / GSS1) TaxID=273116 RepID=Q97A31_THEVO|nr:aldose 1-epimerase [Thermoplasma volcanium]BAB60121.1 TVG1000457 [Thermoplasma volcanium GSS1]
MDISIGDDSNGAVISIVGSHLDKLNLNGTAILLERYDDSPTHFGSAFLFPYANRVRNGEFTLDGKRYFLPKDDENNSIHGLVLSKKFDLVEKIENSVTMRYIMADECYPSPIEIFITHTVSEGKYTCRVKASNRGLTRAPVSAGFHPYFLYNGRWAIKKPRDTWKLEYDGQFPTGKMDKFLFEEDSFMHEFDNQFFADEDIVVDMGSHMIQIERENMPFFVIYNGKYSGGKSVAIEPMMSAVDAFNNGIGLRIVNPGESIEFAYSVEIRE